MLAINRAQMPTDEATLRQALADYLAALEAHKETIDLPKPWPEFDILFAIVETGHSDFAVVDDEKPAPPLTLEQLQVLARQRIDGDREAEIASGVVFNAKPFQTDALSVRNLSATVASIAAGVPLPPGFTWRSTDNVDVPMSADDVRALAAAVLGKGYAAHLKARALKAQIMAATTEADVQAVQWQTP